MDKNATCISIPSSFDGWHTLFIRIGIFLFFTSQIISCKPVMKIIYGVHQPRYVSDANVAQYAEQLDLKGDIYRLKHYAEESRGKFRYLGKRLPETLIFNSHGLITKFEINCNSDFYKMANLTLQAIDSIETGDKSFQDFMADSYVIDSLNAEDIIAFNTPVYIIKFAEFVGKLNKDHIPEQIRILQKRKDIKYILLNMDYTIQE